MKKTLLYPYSGEYLPLFSCGSEYDVRCAVALLGTGYEGKDAGEALLLGKQDLKVETNFDIAISKCDTLLVSENISDPKIAEKAVQAMVIAGKMKKEVVCALEVESQTYSMIQKVCDKLIYLPQAALDNEVDIRTNALYKLRTPVVFVGGLFGFAEEFEIMCMLAHKMRKKGLKVSGVGCSNYCGILDLHRMPSFMSYKYVTDDDRVIKFNHFLAEIENEEQPDLILVQLPGGIMKFNDYVPNSFGILPYIISQSVQSDFFVCCSVFDRFPTEFWDKISVFTNNRFGFGIDCVHLSNTTVFYPDTMDEQRFSTYRTPLSEVVSYLNMEKNSDDISIMNMMTEEGLEMLVSLIEKKIL